jgi:hypothetical protein
MFFYSPRYSRIVLRELPANSVNNKGMGCVCCLQMQAWLNRSSNELSWEVSGFFQLFSPNPCLALPGARLSHPFRLRRKGAWDRVA